MATFYADGTAKFDRLSEAGVATGLVQILGSQQLEIKSNSKLLEQKSKDRGVRGMVTDMVPEKESADFNWTLAGFDRNIVSMALMGLSSDVTTGGGTVTDEAVTARLGILVPLVHGNITAGSVVVTNSGATVTYVEGTDYLIDYAGYLQAKTGGAMTASQSLKVAYAYGAVSGWKVAGDTVTLIQGQFIFDGVNLATGKAFRFTVPKVVFTSDSPFNFLDDKLSEFKFKGKPVLIAGETSTHYFEYFN